MPRNARRIRGRSMPELKKVPTLTMIAVAVSKRVQIEEVRLLQSTIRQSLRDDKAPENVEYAFSAQGANPEGTAKDIAVKTRFHVKAFYSDSDAPAEKAPLFIEAEYLLRYSLSGD